MKKYKIFLLSVLITLLCALFIGLAACTGATGEQGEKGDTGDKGDTGTGITSVNKTGSDGLTDTYTITMTDGTTYTFTVTNGEDGDKGDPGDDGKSAYEIYKEAYNYTGTEAEWLADLINGKLATVSHTVTFNTEGAGDIASQTVNKGDKVTEPETPTLAGHTFLGWYYGEEKWSFIGYSVTENITLTAKWAVTNTEITYTLNTETETYEVTAYTGTDEVIDIRPTVDGIAVTSIAASAFKDATTITSVTIPETITTIGANAFDGCTSLTTVTLPASLTTLGSQAFASSTKISNVYYNGDLAGWLGITFGSGTANPTCYSAALYFTNTDSEYTLVESVTITGVTAINSCAFYGCGSLKSVTIGADVTSIGDYAFKECANLATVTTQGTSTLATIGIQAFYSCTGLTSIDMPDSLTDIGNYAFYQCSSLTSVVIPDSVTTIGSAAFYNCSSLKTITIGSGVTSIGGTAFTGTYNTAVYYNGTLTDWATKITFGNGSGNPLYNYTYLYTTEDESGYTLAKDITLENITVNAYAFSYCSSITSLTINSGVILGDYAFAYCSNLITVTLNASPTISSNAFMNCNKLFEVYDLASIGLTADSSTDNGYLCRYAKAVYTTADAERIVIEVDDYLFYTSGSNYYLYAYTGSETELTLPTLTIEGTETNYSIDGYAFYGNKDIISVTIPDCVTSIGTRVFNYSTLSKLDIGSGVTSIGAYSFNYSAITSITIPSGITSIGQNTFYGCTELEYIVIPSSVTSISSGAFTNCTGLTAVYYYGSASDWDSVILSDDYSDPTYYGATWYYYAEKDSATTAGNYWYYDGDNIVTWTVADASAEGNTEAE